MITFKGYLFLFAVIIGFCPHTTLAEENPYYFQVPEIKPNQVKFDGKVTKREWYKSTQLPFVHDITNKGKVNKNVTIYMQSDGKDIYLGFVVKRPRGYGPPKIVLTEENKSLGKNAYTLSGGEDRVSVVLKTKSGKVLQFTGNAGSIFTSKVNGREAKAGISYLSKASFSQWEGEFKIPVSTLDDTESFYFDFINLQDTPEEKIETLSYRENLDEYNNLWQASLVSPSIIVRMKTEALGRIYENALWFDFFNTADQTTKVTLEYTSAPQQAVPGFEAATLSDITRKLAKYPAVTKNCKVFGHSRQTAYIQLPNKLGKHVISYVIKAEDVEIFRGLFFFDKETPLRVILTPYFLKYKKIRCKVLLDRVTNISSNTTVEFLLLDSKNKILEKNKVRIDMDDKIAQVFLDTDKLKVNSRYTVLVKVLDNGKLLVQKRSAFILPENPEWWKHKLGMETEVPPPFQPLQITSNGIKLWNRAYNFSGKLLPQSIISRGTELLAAPIKLNFSSEGNILEPSDISLESKEVTPGKTVFSYKARYGNILMQAKRLCEFDGLVRYDIELIPLKQPAKLNRLYLEIPLKKEYVKLHAAGYIYTELTKAKGQKEGFSMGYLDRYFKSYPNGTMPFCAAFFLGQDDRGIQWLAENDKDWINKNEDEVIQVEMKNDRVVLQINFIDKETTITQSLKYTWGFITTPIRDISWEKKHFKAAKCDIRGSFPGAPKTRKKINDKYFQSCAKHGIKYMGTYHQMKDHFGAPRSFDPIEIQAFKAHGNLLEKYGLSYYYYSGWGITSKIDESETFAREMFAEPLQQTGFGTYTFNLNSPYLEYYLHGMKHMVQNAGAAGAHLDATYAFFRILANELDGYRFVKNGKVHGSWPIFAMRNFAKRLHTMLNDGKIMKDRGIVHAGYSYPLYCIGGFVTVRGDWEDWYHKKNLKEIPLDVFRIRSADIANGVLARFSWARDLKLPMSTNELMTLCLLHGVRMAIGGEIVYPIQHKDPYGKKSNPMGLINILFNNFGTSKAEFYPYFEKKGFIRNVQPAHILSSVYLYPGNIAIVILGNIEAEKVEAQVEFDWKKLGMKNKTIEIKDGLLPGVNFTRTDNSYTIPINSQRYRILVIKAK